MKSLLASSRMFSGRCLLGGLALGLVSFSTLANAQLYSENFDDGAADDWVVQSGGWQISTGTDKTLDSTTDLLGPEITYYDETSWTTGYTYTANVRRQGSGWGNQVGLVFSYQGPSNYYFVTLGGALDPNGKNLHLYERVGGTTTEVASGVFPTTAPDATPNPCDVAIVRSGNVTTIKVNGVALITQTQTALASGGKIGVVDQYAKGKFNNIVVADSAAPTVSITSPANNATVSNTVNVTAMATDNIGVTGVQYRLDGGDLDPETTSPFTLSWNTTLVPSGAHSLTAVARDAAGNSTESSPVSVTVANSLPAGWTAGDIGSPSPAGSTNYSSSTFIVDGGGANIWGTSDQFHFVRQTASGDCTIVARVNDVGNTQPWAKAGVMIRETAAATSKYVLVCMTPNNGLLFEARTGSTSPSNSSVQLGTDTGIDPPQWLKLSRVGDNFSAYVSSNGTSWTQVGTSQTVVMNTSVLAGLAVCSVNTSALCTATFDNVSIANTDETAYHPDFPRLGIYPIAGNQAYPSTVWPILAKFHLVFLAGNWESWAQGRSYTRQDVVEGIKTSSTVDTKVFQYVIFESAWDDAHASSAWNPTWRATANTNNWWVYQTGSSGTKVVSDWSPYMWVVNMTAAAPDDPVTGWRPYESGAHFAYDQFYDPSSSSGNVAPALDGFFLDNVFWRPRRNGDWDRDNVSDVSTDTTIGDAYRLGEKDFFDTLHTLMPGKLQVGNIADWPQASETNPNAIYPLNGLLNGGLLEGAIGRSNSVETWHSNGTAGLLSWYKYVMDTTAEPKLVILEHSFVGPFTSPSGSSVPSVTNPGADRYDDAVPYRAMRYGLACCLMNNGYYSARGYNPWADADKIQWYDEYDAGGLGAGYLGQPVAGTNGAVQTGPRWAGKGTYGVWAREFTGGLVLMNPKGNGTQTVTISELGGNTVWKRIDGTQAAVNDGSNVTGNITLDERDGLILLRR